MPLVNYKFIQKLMSLGVLLVMFWSVASFAKISAIVELEETGLYGRVHAWKNLLPRSHSIDLDVPANAPIIISDYHSSVGANGMRRLHQHNGIDMFAEIGSPVIAAADGKVVKTKKDSCWGPTILVSHGRDKRGKRVYALYGHVRNINVRKGQRVKRGQQIAEMGDKVLTICGGGIHHLHFQLSYSKTQLPMGWGWAGLVSDGTKAPNPHKYWENGEGKVTCFEKGKQYSSAGLTYPLPCLNKSKPKQVDETILVQREPKPEQIVESTLVQRELKPEQISKKIFVLERPKPKPKPHPVTRLAKSMMEEMFIASGVSHYSLTDEESAAIFSNMSDGPQ